MEKKTDWAKAGEMILEGKSFQEIADYFGVTRQCIHYHFMGGGEDRKCYNDIVYPALREWFIGNRMTYAKFGALVFGKEYHRSVVAAQRMLTGLTKRFTIDLLLKASEVTGMSFEEMFRRVEKQEDSDE